MIGDLLEEPGARGVPRHFLIVSLDRCECHWRFHLEYSGACPVNSN